MPENKPKVGRPRANQTKPAGEVRDEILAAARTLFKQYGFRGTSTRQIADAAGLRQPSLFHYFKNKSEILNAVALGAVQPVLDFIEVEKTQNDPAAVAFYRLVWLDTYHLCTNENALGYPYQFPELTRTDFSEFWQQRDQIINYYSQCLERGRDEGHFKFEELSSTTQLLFSLGESTLTWYKPHSGLDAETVATNTAYLALRSIINDTSRLEDVIAEAAIRP